MEKPKRVTPNNGGCWFCQTKTNDMIFDTEFDTFLHKSCLVEAIKEPKDYEAQIMKYLLER